MAVDLKQLQRDLKAMGLYKGDVDGLWGAGSHGAFLNARRMAKGETRQVAGMSSELFKYCKAVAWSAKQSPEFVNKVKSIVVALGMDVTTADDLMACMAWETGESFSASQVNRAGSGATGLIQFMPGTAIAYFYTTADMNKMSTARKKQAGIESCEKLAKLSDVNQLDYVLKYFQPYKGRLKNLGDFYMAILWPAGIGKDDSYVLWTEADRPTTYRQNAGLDVNDDKVITRAECLIKVNAKLTKGLHPSNLRVG